jgi:DNA-binding response OmpR family regulator
VIPRLPGAPRDLPPPHVLLAADDARLVEALDKALRIHHFRVTLALDGEDVLRRARSELPELVIAGLRLARRSGIELCDTLRREPDLGDVPILLLASADDPETRVEALAHGADDLVAKPISPRELVARAERLVSRARQAARHRQRSRELERALARAEDDLRGAREEAARERALRSLAGGMAEELLHTLDREDLDLRFLREALRQSGARSGSLLARGACGTWRSVAVRGDLAERWAAFELPALSACVDWLRTQHRPLTREEIERLPVPAGESASLATHGVALLARVSAADRAEAVLALEERGDGVPFGARERERLAVLCDAVAPARTAAVRFPDQQERALELLSGWPGADLRRHAAHHESLARLSPIADALQVETGERALLELSLRLGPWAWTAAGRAALDGLAEADPTRRMPRLRELLRDAERCAAGEPPADAGLVAWLVAAGLRFQVLRLSGRSAFESWSTAAAWLGIASHPELRDRFPEAIEKAH